MAKIISKFGDFFNGIGKSKYDNNRFDDLEGVDIHSEPGSVQSSVTFAKESGETVTEACLSAVVPTGDTYFASKSSGKIWKRTSGGSYSLAHTNTNGSGHLGIRYHDGNLYYAENEKLGKFDLSSTWSDNFATFTNADASYKPMAEVNESLFIGDGNFVASVDETGTFSANVLDLPAQHRITALAKWGTSLLVGTIAGSFFNQSGIFRWDTLSPSWNQEDSIDEVGINSFIPADNHVFAQCGTTGNLYYYDGTQLIKNIKIRDITTGVGQEHVAANLNGLPLYGSNGYIYSIGRYDNDFPIALNKEYVVSQGSGTTIHSVIAVGTQILVSYENGANIGIDALTTTKYDGTITTPEVDGSPQNVMVMYDSLPANTSIDLELNVDGGGFSSVTTGWQKNTNRKHYFLKGGIPASNYNHVQARVTLNSDSTSTPVITAIEII